MTMSVVSGTENRSGMDRAPSRGPEPLPGKRKVPRTLVNFWLDAALLLAGLFTLWITVLLQIVFPTATTAAGWELWGLSFDQWRDAQFYAVCGCALLVLEHLVLHWSWVCGVLTTQILHVKNRRDEGGQVIYGVGALIMFLLVMFGTLIAAVLTVSPPPP
jgi:hypothetical protein